MGQQKWRELSRPKGWGSWGKIEVSSQQGVHAVHTSGAIMPARHSGPSCCASPAVLRVQGCLGPEAMCHPQLAWGPASLLPLCVVPPTAAGRLPSPLQNARLACNLSLDGDPLHRSACSQKETSLSQEWLCSARCVGRPSTAAPAAAQQPGQGMPSLLSTMLACHQWQPLGPCTPRSNT